MTKINSKNYFKIFFLVLVLVAGWKLFTDYKVNRLADCLMEKKVVFYGAKWCTHCAKQKKEFGSSFDKVNYFECSKIETTPQLQECFAKEIKKYPTWAFGEKEKIEGFMSLKSLDEKAACGIGF